MLGFLIIGGTVICVYNYMYINIMLIQQILLQKWVLNIVQNVQLYVCPVHGVELTFEPLTEITGIGLFAGTHDVQNTNISKNDSMREECVDATGELARNTTALGCFILFNSTCDSFEHYQAAMRSDDSCNAIILNLEEGTYSVLVYDLESETNGLPGSSPAVSMTGVVVTESKCT